MRRQAPRGEQQVGRARPFRHEPFARRAARHGEAHRRVGGLSAARPGDARAAPTAHGPVRAGRAARAAAASRRRCAAVATARRRTSASVVHAVAGRRPRSRAGRGHRRRQNRPLRPSAGSAEGVLIAARALASARTRPRAACSLAERRSCPPAMPASRPSTAASSTATACTTPWRTYGGVPYATARISAAGRRGGARSACPHRAVRVGQRRVLACRALRAPPTRRMRSPYARTAERRARAEAGARPTRCSRAALPTLSALVRRTALPVALLLSRVTPARRGRLKLVGHPSAVVGRVTAHGAAPPRVST